jgi:hypothetical protein
MHLCVCVFVRACVILCACACLCVCVYTCERVLCVCVCMCDATHPSFQQTPACMIYLDLTVAYLDLEVTRYALLAYLFHSSLQSKTC